MKSAPVVKVLRIRSWTDYLFQIYAQSYGSIFKTLMFIIFQEFIKISMLYIHG